MKFILIIGLIFLTITSFSQGNEINYNNNQIEIRIKDNSDEVEMAEGSPYIVDHFQAAEINGYDKVYQVRYNASTDQMEVKVDNNKTVVILNNIKNYRIKLLDDQKEYRTVTYDDGSVGYAVMYWEGKNDYGLYKREKIRFYPGQKANNGYQSSKKARYIRIDDVLFLKIPKSDNLIEVPANKKKLSKILSNEEIVNYIKTKNIDLKNIEDVKKVLQNFYN